MVLADTQFGRIPVKPEIERAWIRRQVEEYENELNEMKEKGDDDSPMAKRSQKDMQNRINHFRDKVTLLEKQISERRDNDDTIYFTNLGIDQLFVDEADRYKNLYFPTNKGDIKGFKTPGHSGLTICC